MVQQQTLQDHIDKDNCSPFCLMVLRFQRWVFPSLALLSQALCTQSVTDFNPFLPIALQNITNNVIFMFQTSAFV